MQRQQMRTGHEHRSQGTFWQHFRDANQQMMADTVKTNTMVIRLEKLPAQDNQAEKINLRFRKQIFINSFKLYCGSKLFKPVSAPF
jgi:hypothetical protein